MTKRYEYKFLNLQTVSGKPELVEIVLKKTVTDKMEPRDSWKKVEATNYFTNVLREKYGFKSCAHSRDVAEIS